MGAAPARRGPLPVATVVRAMVALLVLLDVSGGWTLAVWWELPTTVLSGVASITALHRPVAAFWMLATLMLGSEVLGEIGAWQVPFIICTISLAVVSRARHVVLVTAALTGMLLAIGGGNWGFVRSTLGVQLGCLAIGLAVRVLNRHRRRAAARIQTLDRTVRELRAQERRALADELSDLLDRSIEDTGGALAGLDASRGAPALAAALQEVGEHSRTTLLRLRRLVTILHPGAATAHGQPVDLPAVLDEVEDELSSHAYWVEVDRDPAVAVVAEPAGGVLADVVRAAAAHVHAAAPPGGRCDVRLAGDAQQLQLLVRHEDQTATSDPGPTLRALTDRARALGGQLATHQGDGWWQLDLTLPSRATTPPTPEGSQTADGDPAPAGPSGFGNPWTLALSLLCIALAVRSGADALHAEGWHQAVRPLQWTAAWVGLLMAVRWLRAGCLWLLATLAFTMATTAPPQLMEHPVHLQLFLASTLLFLRRPRLVALHLLGWLLLGGVWALLGGQPGAVLPLWLPAILGIGTGLSAHHFLTSRREQLAELERLADEQRRAREQERLTLATELHDIVAHQLSLMGLEVAAHAGSTDVDELLGSVARVERMNHSARADLDTLVALMREELPLASDGAQGRDLPGIASALGEARAARPGAEQRWSTPTATARAVAQNLEQAGHRVDLRVEPDADDCDPTTARTAARVLREAATNILRHAPAGSDCTIDLAHRDELLVLRITNPMPTRPQRHPDSTGLGLAGLAERIELTGGSFTAGPTLGRWRIACELPRHPDGRDTRRLTAPPVAPLTAPRAIPQQ